MCLKLAYIAGQIPSMMQVVLSEDISYERKIPVVPRLTVSPAPFKFFKSETRSDLSWLGIADDGARQEPSI